MYCSTVLVFLNRFLFLKKKVILKKKEKNQQTRPQMIMKNYLASLTYGNLTSLLGNFSCFCCLLSEYFQNGLFQKNLSRLANGLSPDQDRCSVGPDLGPNCLQRLSADDKSQLGMKELKRTLCVTARWNTVHQNILYHSIYVQISISHSFTHLISYSR